MSELDAQSLISGDLQDLRRERALHFRVAQVLAVLAPALLLLYTGLRDDLLRQPVWMLGLQGLVWLLALLALPAIGLGLWFPSRGARLALSALAALTASVVAIGPELADLPGASGLLGGFAFGYCTYLTLGAGALVLAVCAVSGAFAQRRRPATALWLATSVVLVAVDTTTWHCPATQLDHTVPMHLGSAALLLLIAAAAGLALHRGQRGDA